MKDFLTPSLTPRGFQRFTFEDEYGQKCSLQKSSLAERDAIWIGVDIDLRGGESSRMHLTQDMVRALLPRLQHFVETGELPDA